jgi:hypothetical protein
MKWLATFQTTTTGITHQSNPKMKWFDNNTNHSNSKYSLIKLKR